VPQRQGDNPVEQGEEDPNSEGTQEKVSKENDFFPLHDSSLISNGGIDTRLSGLRNLRELGISMEQLGACESVR
jgi:hypothetical protein